MADAGEGADRRAAAERRADREDAAERHAPREDHRERHRRADAGRCPAAARGASRRRSTRSRSRSRRRFRPRAPSANRAASRDPRIFLHPRQRRRQGIADDARRAVGGQRKASTRSRRHRRTRHRAGAAAASPSGWRRPGNPLTARVMVNRIWQHHFGEGIVRTPSNFGKLGERPSHPELLDWLAVEFVERGWSVKAMHRLMMTSEAYQMASDDIAANVAIDPENRSVLAHAAAAARGRNHPRQHPGRGRHARSHARAGPTSSPTSIPICSRPARGGTGRASPTTIRRRGGAASTSSRSAASAIRCSKPSISRT